MPLMLFDNLPEIAERELLRVRKGNCRVKPKGEKEKTK
jgi:hypothetical protein